MRALVSVGLGLILAGGLAGCPKGPGKDLVLVHVGQQGVTLAEFQRAFDEAVARGEGLKADTTSARRFLEDYIQKTLLEQIATDSLNWTELLEHRAVSYMETMMVRAMQRDAYGRAADVPEADVRKAYEKGRSAYRYRELACPTREDALQKLATVREGAQFARMVERGAAGDPGGAGWRTILEVPEGIIDVLARLGPEEVGGPVESEGRFWLVQLLEKSDNPTLPPFEQVSHGLKINLARERGGRLLRAFRDELTSKYHYEPRMATVIWMTEFLHEQTRDVPREYTPPAAGGATEFGMPASTEKPVWTSNPLNEEESARILAVATGDTISAVLFLDHLNTKPSFTWPRFDKPEDVMRLLEELALSRLEFKEAWARGYDKDPDISWAARKNRNLILTRQYVRQHVLQRARMSPEKARAWWESQPRQGATQGRRRYLMVDLATSELAERAAGVLSEVRDAAAAYERIRGFDPTANWLGPRGFPVNEASATGEFDREIFRLPLGGVTRPHAVGERFSVGRVEEILVASKPAQSFEEVQAQVVEQYAETRIDSVINHDLAERRRATTIQVDEKVFKKIRYTAPAATAKPAAPAGR